ncbi:hypothetical protein NADFUDRAFT_53140 [Nadsonia fulvescens var. elongata DSM 6958]|uniref:SMP-30/Gluconolactonase/LRE-like region domain-containing protein n=1 Tax=Nadsonia fulvescens var. elongata DSM 6958 TaxID=857566 RepID=A0A1E3PDL2_9ASCO|nr:hypothetical protein NADFUDRAFT_53140 [Nadsonia fulvescens var. elongata DSM 6958]
MTEVPIIKTEKPFISFNGRLSEGPLYDPRDNSLAWVDIIDNKVFRAQLSFATTTEHEQVPIVKCFEVDDPIGCLGLTEQVGRYIAGCRFGIAYLDLNSVAPHLSLDYIKRLDRHTTIFSEGDMTDIQMRLNDGVVAPDGSFYFGSMLDFDSESKYGTKPLGHLYCLDDFASVNDIRLVLDGLSIPNGMAFDPADPAVVYLIDSETETITKYHYEAATKSFSDPKVFFDFKNYFKLRPNSDTPQPDGCVVTADGSLWTAVWGTGTVLRINIKTAAVAEEYQFPAARVTCPTFGGLGGDDMFVTSASLDIDGKGGPVGEDRGGDIFRVKIDSGKDKTNFYQSCSKSFIFRGK